MRRPTVDLRPLVLLVAWLSACAGCSTELVPAEEIQAPFSLYGVISPQLDAQSVLVYPIEPFFAEQRPEDIDEIRVTSTNLGTGETQTWADTVVINSRGQYEFMFRAPFQAEHGATYRIEAERVSDGAISYAEVRVPDSAAVEIVDPRPQGLEVAIRGDGIRALTPVARYVIQGLGGAPPRVYAISYEGTEREIEDGWLVEIKLALDREPIQGLYNTDTGYTLSHCGTAYLNALHLDVLVGDRPWDPLGGSFDADVLQQPGTMSNVENGFGFVGAGYRERANLKLSRDLVEGACFLYPE